MTWPTTFHDDDRGVSNALGFILIFGIIIASITFVFTMGTDSIEEIREDEQMANAERAMYIAYESIDAIQSQDVPGRDAQIKLSDAQLTASANGTEVTVKVDGTTVVNESTSSEFQYEGPGGKITYEKGALFTNYAGSENALMVEEPAMEFGDDRVFISLVKTVGNGGASADGTHLVVFRNSGSTVKHFEDSTTNSTVQIRVETTPPRAEEWAEYFSDEGLTEVSSKTDIESGVVVYEYDAETILVRQTEVEIRFE